jgi:hypothetical protein
MVLFLEILVGIVFAVAFASVVIEFTFKAAWWILRITYHLCRLMAMAVLAVLVLYALAAILK